MFSIFSGQTPNFPGLYQFVWTDYDQAFVVFSCYNVTGEICYNYGVGLWSRDTRRLDSETQKKVHQLHDTRTLCVNKGKTHEMSHTFGMFIKTNYSSSNINI